MAENVKIKTVCRKAKFARKVRFRDTGSVFIKFWLARTISGSIQHVSVSSGDEIGSVPSCWVIFIYGRVDKVSNFRLVVAIASA